MGFTNLETHLRRMQGMARLLAIRGDNALATSHTEPSPPAMGPPRHPWESLLASPV